MLGSPRSTRLGPWALTPPENAVTGRVTSGLSLPPSPSHSPALFGPWPPNAMNDPVTVYGSAIEVRHVHPFEASKAYTCPFCQSPIGAGVGHEVVVPNEAPDLRRHWHSNCWRGYVAKTSYRGQP